MYENLWTTQFYCRSHKVILNGLYNAIKNTVVKFRIINTSNEIWFGLIVATKISSKLEHPPPPLTVPLWMIALTSAWQLQRTSIFIFWWQSYRPKKYRTNLLTWCVVSIWRKTTYKITRIHTIGHISWRLGRKKCSYIKYIQMALALVIKPR